MDYQKHYDALISRARTRKLDGYFERHHAVPRCMGGNNSKENLVDLTAEEHYVAHQLLVKIYPDNRKLIFAAHKMTSNSPTQKRSNKLYGWIRKAVSNARRGVPMSEEQKIALRSANLGKHHTEETKRKMSLAKKGKPSHPNLHSEEAREKRKQSLAANGSKTGWPPGEKRPKWDEESRLKRIAGMNEANKKETVKKNRSQAMQKWWDERRKVCL